MLQRDKKLDPVWSSPIAKLAYVLPRRAVLMSGLGALMLSGCAVYNAMPLPDAPEAVTEPFSDVAGFVGGLWPDRVPASERTWRSVNFNTDVTWVTDDTARIEARGGPLTGIESVEFRLLARAAGEGARRGATSFKIIHLRDRNYASAGRFWGMPAFDAARTRHIGSYEDLVASRYERDWSAAPRAWTHPGLTAVVIYTEEAPTRRRPLFNVEELYRNLVMDGEIE